MGEYGGGLIGQRKFMPLESTINAGLVNRTCLLYYELGGGRMYNLPFRHVTSFSSGGILLLRLEDCNDSWSPGRRRKLGHSLRTFFEAFTQTRRLVFLCSRNANCIP